MNTAFELGDKEFILNLPEEIKILKMKGTSTVTDPAFEIEKCLNYPIGSVSFDTIVEKKLKKNPASNAVIVISDNTRPVPYKGKQGILLPLVDKLLSAGLTTDRITILCANGTHTPLPDTIFHEMIDSRIFEKGISVINHDCLDDDNLLFMGYTSKGTEIKINKTYVEADIKILTGLVESHFMAGVSGGRKSICPGLIGENSTFIFHSVQFLDNKYSKDLNLIQNPCHEEALEVAHSVGADFIFNVTLNDKFDVTGYFAGDMEKAHLAAYEKVKQSVGIHETETYDIVVTHSGFVGKNHYQAAKAAIAALPLLKKDSYLIMAGDCIDVDPVGKDTYRKVLPFLKNTKSDDFINLLKSDKWQFVPDQWQVQMWAKLFQVIPQKNFLFYAPQLTKEDYKILSGEDGNNYLSPDSQYGNGSDGTIVSFLESALKQIRSKLELAGRKNIKTAWFADGPYGIVLK